MRPHELLLQAEGIRIGAGPHAPFLVRERMAHGLLRQGRHQSFPRLGFGPATMPDVQRKFRTQNAHTGRDFTYPALFPAFIARTERQTLR
jgi:hypothetical protein